MIIAGGFGESHWVQHELRKEYGAKGIAVVVPPEPSIAVLLGAVAYGLDPSAIEVRRARLSFGIANREQFDPRLAHHLAARDAGRVFETDGVLYVKDLLLVLVRENDELHTGVTVAHYVKVKCPDLKLMTFKTYTSERADAHFVDEPGVKRCGTLLLDISDPAKGPSRYEKVILSLLFVLSV